MPGYNLVCRNRQINTRGGVAIYIKDTFKFKRRYDLEVNVDGEFESIIIEAEFNNSKVIVGEIYRVPNTSESDSISRYDTILNTLLNNKMDTMLGTDQNFDYVNIDQHKNTCELLNTFITSGFLPVITHPTRVTRTTSTLIDNIYINGKVDKYNINSAVLNCDISDHFPVCIFYGKKTQPSKQRLCITSRHLNDVKIVEITNSLGSVNWNY